MLKKAVELTKLCGIDLFLFFNDLSGNLHYLTTKNIESMSQNIFDVLPFPDNDDENVIYDYQIEDVSISTNFYFFRSLVYKALYE